MFLEHVSPMTVLVWSKTVLATVIFERGLARPLETCALNCCASAICSLSVCYFCCWLFVVSGLWLGCVGCLLLRV